MSPIKGWNTIGATEVGRMDDGRFNIVFTGVDDGIARNIFIPAKSLAHMLASLVAVNAATAKDFPDIGDEISGQFLIGVQRCSVAADNKGTEFVLSLVSRDGMELRFHLDPNIAEAVAIGLASSLAAHGKAIDLSGSGGATSH